MAKKYCYLFTEGNAKMRELLGGKGANLAEMTGLGLPVPQGFTISTEACTQYYDCLLYTSYDEEKTSGGGKRALRLIKTYLAEKTEEEYPCFGEFIRLCE